jgi:sugar/nucleoside kinase (ribokinase family)
LVATALVAAARLGARCHLYGLVGDDQVGGAIRKELEDEGVSTAHMVVVPGASSPLSFVHVDQDSGERTIYHWSGDSLVEPRSMDLSEVGECDALVVDSCFPRLALAAAQTARACEVPVIADARPSSANADLMREVDVLIAPRQFARDAGLDANPDAALDAIHEFGPKTAVITLGADGWVYSTPDGRGRGPAFSVDVVDTTGAGDVFHGAFAFGMTKGWDTDRCAEFAGAVAAVKCTRLGGRTGIPDLARTLEYLEKNGSLAWPVR